MGKALPLCVVCWKWQCLSLMCRRCGASYDRAVRKDETTFALIHWAAQRARKFERERQLKMRQEVFGG